MLCLTSNESRSRCRSRTMAIDPVYGTQCIASKGGGHIPLGEGTLIL